ncbi:MAG TPA: organomercurial lyase [Candidatus Dormibacteraeota bacterium]|nr:organomercurial lyase [Candidatus Dormibacteraeota bacterium]
MTDAETVTRVRLAVLSRTAASAKVPNAGELSSVMGVDEPAVVDAYRVLGEGHVYVLEPNDPTRLRMANPFSAVQTTFVVEVGQRHYYGNCVWDALGIVSMLGGNGTVSTACPDCHEPLTLKVTDRKLVDGPGIVYFGVPARRWWDDIIFT